MLLVTNLWMTSHVWDSETFRNVHPQVVSPGQGCHKLNTTNTVQLYRIHYWESPGSGYGAGSSQTEHTHIKFSFTWFITGKLNSQIVGPGAGSSQTEHNTNTVQFYRIHYRLLGNCISRQLARDKVVTNWTQQIQFSFTGFIIGKLHP